MGLFSLFSKPEKPSEQLTDLSMVSVDVHSHIIPGIDDGSPDMETSLQIIRALHSLGYSKFILTPHVMSDYYRNTPEMIQSGAQAVSEAVKKAGIPVCIEAGAEYYIDYEFQDKLKKQELLTFGNKYLLFELSLSDETIGLMKVLFDMQVAGYRLIIAHPERYSYWHNNFENYEKLKDREILIQLNINSLSGEYSIPVKKMAEKLIDMDMVDLIGTDTHTITHVETIRTLLANKHLIKLVQSGRLLNKKLFG